MTAPARTPLPALYLGGLLGPFGGGVVATMLPVMASDLGTSLGVAGATMTTYFIFFAAAQLVSGTLGERWGRQRTVRWAYLAYAAASILCALAPTAEVLLVGRSLQGLANAFVTPMLLAGLTELVSRERLSRSVGVFGAFQAAGQSLAPLFGGLAQLVHWRSAFWLVAAVSLVLALFPPPGGPRKGAAAPRFRELATGRIARISLAGSATYLAAAGLPFLVALLAEDSFHVSPTIAGLMLAGFGLAGIATATLWGGWSQRRGPGITGAVGMGATAVLVALVPLMPNAVLLTVLWTAVGAASTLSTVSLQNLAVREVPGNRGGTVSVVSAFRFGGSALAPMIFLPLYGVGATPTFLVAAAVAVMGTVLFLSVRPPRRP